MIEMKEVFEGEIFHSHTSRLTGLRALDVEQVTLEKETVPNLSVYLSTLQGIPGNTVDQEQARPLRLQSSCLVKSQDTLYWLQPTFSSGDAPATGVR